MAGERVQQVKADLTNLCNYFDALTAMGAHLEPDPQLAALCARMQEIQSGLECPPPDQHPERLSAARRTARQRSPRSGSAHPKPSTSMLDLEDRIMVMVHRHAKETHTPAQMTELLHKDGWKPRADGVDKVEAILRDLAAHPDSGVLEFGNGYYRAAPIESIGKAKQLISEVLERGSGHLGVGTAEQVGQILVDGGWDAPTRWELVVDRALASLALTPDSRVRRITAKRYEFLPKRFPATLH
ncbi:hypothetical protein AB0H76_20415 [Nocardia sp. NPDC050712]|uniref:hypothetical protein n=1 Tax=Nocardia sp. NPDC050712 TaxID=3155518 RepID=UPI0033DB353B